MFMKLVFWKLFVLLLLLVLTVYEVKVNIPHWCGIYVVIKDMKRLYVTCWYLPMLLYVVELPNFAIGKLSTSTLEWIFSATVFSA